MNKENIARVCHEVNRAYCQALGDHSQPAWEDAPQWQRDSALVGVDLHMSGDHGPEASHESWMKQKFEDGWIHGPIKSPGLKQHPCMVPFNELPPEQQAKDFIFRAVVHALRAESAVTAEAEKSQSLTFKAKHEAMRTEIVRLRTALRFYASGQHHMLDESEEFDTVSGEPDNWLCSGREDSTTMVENGRVALFALRGIDANWLDGGEDSTPGPVDGEVSSL